MAAALGTVVLLISITMRATASPSARLIYIRDVTAASCPDEADLRQAAKQRIGYDPFFVWAKTTVVVEVAREGKTFVAHVRLTDEDGMSRGSRELRYDGAGCAGLIDAAALAISIALDVSVPSAEPPAPATTSAPVVEPPGPSELSPATVPKSASPPEFTDSSARIGPIHGLMGIDALLAIDAAPSTTVGMDVWASARKGIGSLGLELRADLPATTVGAEGGRATATLFAATATPCAHTGAFVGCVLGSIGWLEASGAGVRVPRSGSAFFPAVGPRVGLEFPLGKSLALNLRADLLVNFLRPTVALDQAPVWTLPHFSAFVAAGLAYPFP
jgi:hypothetical protein